MGGRASLPAGYLEELDRDACLELFNEYNQLNAEKY